MSILLLINYFPLHPTWVTLRRTLNVLFVPIQYRIKGELGHPLLLISLMNISGGDPQLHLLKIAVGGSAFRCAVLGCRCILAAANIVLLRLRYMEGRGRKLKRPNPLLLVIVIRALLHPLLDFSPVSVGRSLLDSLVLLDGVEIATEHSFFHWFGNGERSRSKTHGASKHGILLVNP